MRHSPSSRRNTVVSRNAFGAAALLPTLAWYRSISTIYASSGVAHSEMRSKATTLPSRN
jgi:hypothetical protein